MLLLVVGCAHYEPRPIEPAKTAAALEFRTLANGALRSFLQQNLHREFTQWPATQWDFDMLTLAAFYYQPDLDLARAQWNSAEAEIQTAGSRPNPSVTAAAAYNSDIPSISPWMPTVSFDVPLETAGKRRRRIEQAQHLSESSRYNIAATAWQVRSQLRDALLDAVSARQRVDLLQHQLSLQEELHSRLQQQFQAGAIASADVVPAGIALAKTHSDLADARSRGAAARARVATAVGVPAAALEGIAFDFSLDPPAALDSWTLAQARAAALLGRADILGALADYAAAQSALKLEIAKQYPDVHLSPGYAWNANQTGDNQWQLGLTLDLPLLNQNQGPIAQAEARRRELAAKFLALQAKVIGSLDQASAQLESSRISLAAIQALSETQKQQRELAESQFNAGALEPVDRIGAEIEFSSAALAELDARLKLQQAIGALEDAMQRPLAVMQAPVFEPQPDRKENQP